MLKKIRVWQELDIEEINKQLVIADDSDATCNNCKHLGLKFPDHVKCPACGSQFNYVLPANNSIELINRLFAKIKKANLKCRIIEREDYQKAKAKTDIHSLFK